MRHHHVTVVCGRSGIAFSGLLTWRANGSGYPQGRFRQRFIPMGYRANARVSDLNCFWLAIDPEQPDDLFANRSRGGKFRNYHPLRLYYVGYGANDNTTTRFRRYPGDGTRPCLPEHDLRDKRFMHTPDRTMKIRIVVNGGRVQYFRDGGCVFDFLDEILFRKHGSDSEPSGTICG